MKYRQSVSSTTVVVAAIVLICLFATAIAVAAEVSGGVSSSTTPVITTILSTLGAAVVGLLALIKATHAEAKTDAVNRKVDGHLERLTTVATTAAAASGDPALVEHVNEVVTNGGEA